MRILLISFVLFLSANTYAELAPPESALKIARDLNVSAKEYFYKSRTIFIVDTSERMDDAGEIVFSSSGEKICDYNSWVGWSSPYCNEVRETAKYIRTVFNPKPRAPKEGLHNQRPNKSSQPIR